MTEIFCTCGHPKSLHSPYEEGLEVIATAEPNPDLSGFTACSGNNDDCECAVFEMKRSE